MIITHQVTTDGILTVCWRYLENPNIVDDDTDFQLVQPYWETVALQHNHDFERENLFYFEGSPGETINAYFEYEGHV